MPFPPPCTKTATRPSSRHVVVLLVVTALFTWAPARSQARQPVYLAGLAYLGDFQYVSANYPLTRKLDENGQIESALSATLHGVEPQNIELRSGLADLDRTDTIVLAVAVDRERVSREVFEFRQGVRTKLIVELSLQLLFYDLAAGTLLDNRPVSAAINHVIEEPDVDLEAESLRRMRHLYLGDGQSTGLLAQIADMLRHFELDAAPGLRFQLEALVLDDRVLPLLPEHRSAVQVSQGFGQWFSARLAEHTGVRVIPFTRGYAIGNQLPGRFSNGEAFDLELPPPDYALRFEIRNLIQKNHERQILFGVQARFTLEEPFARSVLIDGDFRSGVAKLATAARIEADDWSAYEDAIESLLEDIVLQLETPERRWHDSHARDEDSLRQFKENKELFDGR